MPLTLVDEGSSTVRQPLDDELGLILDYQAVPLFAPLQRLLCAFAVSDVEGGHHHLGVVALKLY